MGRIVLMPEARIDYAPWKPKVDCCSVCVGADLPVFELLGDVVRLGYPNQPDLPALVAIQAGVDMARKNDDNRGSTSLTMRSVNMALGVIGVQEHAYGVDQRVYDRLAREGTIGFPDPRIDDRYQLLRHPDLPLLHGGLGVAALALWHTEDSLWQIFSEYEYTGRTNFR